MGAMAHAVAKGAWWRLTVCYCHSVWLWLRLIERLPRGLVPSADLLSLSATLFDHSAPVHAEARRFLKEFRVCSCLCGCVI